MALDRKGNAPPCDAQASSPVVCEAGQRPAPQELTKLFLRSSQSWKKPLYKAQSCSSCEPCTFLFLRVPFSFTTPAHTRACVYSVRRAGLRLRAECPGPDPRKCRAHLLRSSPLSLQVCVHALVARGTLLQECALRHAAAPAPHCGGRSWRGSEPRRSEAPRLRPAPPCRSLQR